MPLKVTMYLPASRAALSGALEGLTRVNYELMRAGNLPPLYRAGVRYKREPGREEWLNAPELLKRRVGDCEDLAAYRAAELRMSGVPARAVAKRTGRRTFHAVVLWPDGTIEDPSRALGMERGRRH